MGPTRQRLRHRVKAASDTRRALVLQCVIARNSVTKSVPHSSPYSLTSHVTLFTIQLFAGHVNAGFSNNLC